MGTPKVRVDTQSFVRTRKSKGAPGCSLTLWTPYSFMGALWVPQYPVGTPQVRVDTQSFVGTP